MTGLGPLQFLEPALLSALLLLPLIWLIIRTLPPPVKSVFFPPLAFLRGLQGTEPPPDSAPLWIILLRMAMAALIILALARPVWNGEEEAVGEGSVMIILDDGWEAASRWPERLAAVENIVAGAERAGRPVILAATARPVGTADIPAITAFAAALQPRSASEVRERLGKMVPAPWSPDHQGLAEALAVTNPEPGQIIWLSDGINRSGTAALRERLAALAALELRTGPPARFPMALLPPKFEGLDIVATIVRPARRLASEVEVEAMAADGRRISGVAAHFEAGEETATARISLPQDIRNQVAALRISGERSAGAVVALDVRAGRPLVGIVEDADPSLPLLRTAGFYLSRALEPYSALIAGSLAEVLAENPSLLFVVDQELSSESVNSEVTSWVNAGGVLVRFAGPRMAIEPGLLVPVRLRSGGRSFGGTLTWDTPKHLRPFSEASPFFGLPVPDDVSVSRQLLAAPGPELAAKTWAALEDGTPLVTADRLGNGWIILFHTTANADWSDIPLSGLYVGMLRRILPFARAAGSHGLSGAPEFLSPLQSFDGFGDLRPATAEITPIRRDVFEQTVAGPDNPPGLYGPEGTALALNLASDTGPVSAQFRFAEFDRGAWGAIDDLGVSVARDLGPALLAAAIILALIDILAGRWLMGRPISGLRSGGLRRGTSLMLVLMLAIVLLAPVGHLMAQELDDEFVLDATGQTRLAWVPTGVPALDTTIEAGLRGLARIVRVRTAVQLAEAIAIDPERDPMALFPLIYWPVTENTDASLETRRNLAQYLATGGMVLFDAGVGDPARSSLGLERPQSRAALQRLLQGIALPRLAPVDGNHVLSRSFYILDRFPGRIRGRPVWIEENSANSSGRVSRTVIGAGDWPSAWAIDNRGLPIVRDLSGGEGQRELAYRFGINLVMYALTGTYKDDQLHMPLIMDRLGE